MATTIHPTAIVHRGAQLGERITVGPYSVIGEHVAVGDGTTIGSNALVDGRTTIGCNNSIFHGASIGTVPQDLKYRGAASYVTIGDDNTVREFVTINSATQEGESTVVGNRNLLMAYVHIAHNCRICDDVILANAVNLGGHVTVHDHAIVGGVVPVHQFVTIGAYAFIGGGSRISKDVPPFIKVAGNPPRVSGINSVGLRRRNFTTDQRALIKKAFTLLYRSELNVTQALARIEQELPRTSEIGLIVDFIRGSRRGITK